MGAVRTTGDWEAWLDFFLHGVVETSNQGVQTSKAVSALFQADQDKIAKLKRAGRTMRQAHAQLQKTAISNVINMAAILGVSVPTARLALNNLKDLGIVNDINGSGKERLYIYSALIDLLEQGAEPVSLEKRKRFDMTTDYQSQYLASLLDLQEASDSVENLSRSIANARVELNPHQVDAALFAFRSPLSKGVVLADEVGLGKTIEAGIAILQKWAERKRNILCFGSQDLQRNEEGRKSKPVQSEKQDRHLLLSLRLE